VPRAYDDITSIRRERTRSERDKRGSRVGTRGGNPRNGACGRAGEGEGAEGKADRFISLWRAEEGRTKGQPKESGGREEARPEDPRDPEERSVKIRADLKERMN